MKFTLQDHQMMQKAILLAKKAFTRQRRIQMLAACWLKMD